VKSTVRGGPDASLTQHFVVCRMEGHDHRGERFERTPVAPTIFPKRPFGENVEGLSSFVHVQARRIGETAHFQQKMCEFADSTPPGLVQRVFGQSLTVEFRTFITKEPAIKVLNNWGCDFTA